MDNNGAQKINSILQGFLSDPDVSTKLKKFSLFNHWDEIVGKEIAAKTRPLKIFKGVLHISVANPTWANELNMMSPELIERINVFIGVPEIKKLKFTII